MEILSKIYIYFHINQIRNFQNISFIYLKTGISKILLHLPKTEVSKK